MGKKFFEPSFIPKFEINTSPAKCVASEKMLLTCEKKYSWGWGESDNSNVSSTNKDSEVLYGNSKGGHRIYLRQFSGKQMKENIDIRMY